MTSREQAISSMYAWKETALLHLQNEMYYRGLVIQIGEMFGEEAYIQDDGGRSEFVLCAKVPELVAKLMEAKPTHEC